MSSRLFTIIGDPIIRRNMTDLNVSSREVMKTAQVIDFTFGTPIDQVLAQMRTESNFCIFAALTDLLLGNGDCGTISASIDPILNSIFLSMATFCTAHPDVQVRVIVYLNSVTSFLFLFLFVVPLDCNP